MFLVRKSNERGFADHGWLKSYHTFSFADYYDPRFMGFGDLRVINEDRVEGGQGFQTHGHRDMEIVSYVISGALEHKDSMGNTSVIYPGEIQRMTAGTGVRHSEFNHYADQVSHFLQIWILPNEKNLQPSYEQKKFELQPNQWNLVGSMNGKDGSVLIHQDVNVYLANLSLDSQIHWGLAEGRQYWLQVIQGDIELVQNNNLILQSGDGFAFSLDASSDVVKSLEIKAKASTQLILFDLKK